MLINFIGKTYIKIGNYKVYYLLQYVGIFKLKIYCLQNG